jgi:hypothetical protein
MIGSTINMTKDTVNSVIDFNPSRMSKEAMGEYVAQKTAGYQMGAVNAAGKTLEGAGYVGGFVMGGILPSLAVGGAVGAVTGLAAGSMINGAQNALNYEEILRRDGYKAFNAFESTTEFGGIGMKLGDQQEMSGFMRDLSDEKFLEDDEMAKILQGSLDQKLLKSVSDVKSFKEKFTKIVDSVKEISLTLNQSIDEAVEFMGEMERRGVNTEKVTSMSSQFKVGASMLGMDANQYSQQVLQQTDSIVGGTSTSASNVMSGVALNSYLVSAVEEVSSDGDGTLKQFIKNNGGGGAVAGQVESDMRSFIQGAGQKDLLAMFSSAFDKGEDGQFALNEGKLQELVGSGKDVYQLMDESSSYLKTLDPTDQAKLSRTAGQAFNESASSFDMMGAIGFMQEKMMSEFGVDSETALVELGVTQDYNMAEVLNQVITAGTDPDAVGQFDARSLKEEMDANSRASNPGIKARAKFWLDTNIGNPLGDVGQGISNRVGNVGEDIQMSLSGIEKDGVVGGDLLPEYTTESIEQMFVGEDSNLGKIRKEMTDYDKVFQEQNRDQKGRMSMGSYTDALDWKEPEAIKTMELSKSFSYDQFERYDDMIKSGKLEGSEMRRMRDMLDDKDVDVDSKQRIEYLLNRESGEYDGFSNQNKKADDYGKAIYENSESANKYDTSGGSQNSKEDIERMQDDLKKKMGSAGKDLKALMASSADLGTDDYRGLEQAIKTGDTETVNSMTQNDEARSIAENYKKLNNKGVEVSAISKDYTEIIRQTAAAGEYAEGVVDFLGAGKIFDKTELDAYFGEYKKESKKMTKDVSKMSDQELYETNTILRQQGEDIFSSMTQEELIKTADYLTTKDRTVSMDDLYANAETGTIDAYKLYDSLMGTMRKQQSGDSVAEDKMKEDAGLGEAGAAREGAMADFVGSVMGETAILQKAVEDMKTGNGGKYTSTST